MHAADLQNRRSAALPALLNLPAGAYAAPLQLLYSLDDEIAGLYSTDSLLAFLSDVRRPVSVCEHFFDSCFDRICLFAESERVSEHHR